MHPKLKNDWQLRQSHGIGIVPHNQPEPSHKRWVMHNRVEAIPIGHHSATPKQWVGDGHSVTCSEADKEAEECNLISRGYTRQCNTRACDTHLQQLIHTLNVAIGGSVAQRRHAIVRLAVHLSTGLHGTMTLGGKKNGPQTNTPHQWVGHPTHRVRHITFSNGCSIIKSPCEAPFPY